MEVIRLRVTEDEKVNIAQRYLPPKQEPNNWRQDEEMDVTESAVRNHPLHARSRRAFTEREISKICRKGGIGVQLKKHDGKVIVTVEPERLPVRKYDYGQAAEEPVGQGGPGGRKSAATC